MAGPKTEQKGRHEKMSHSRRSRGAHRERHYTKKEEEEKEEKRKDEEAEKGEVREWYNRDKQVIDAPQGPHCRCSPQTMAICFCLATKKHVPPSLSSPSSSSSYSALPSFSSSSASFSSSDTVHTRSFSYIASLHLRRLVHFIPARETVETVHERAAHRLNHIDR